MSLNDPLDLQSLIDTGMTFHSLRAAILNAQSLKSLSLFWGTVNWVLVCSEEVLTIWRLDRSVCILVLSWSISLIYYGAWSCTVQNTRSSPSKSILFSTWSQCNDFSTGIMWSKLHMNSLAAAALCQHCSFWDTWLRQTIKESITIIQAWTNENMSNLVWSASNESLILSNESRVNTTQPN